MEYIGKTRNYGDTKTFTINGVYTVQEYYNLRDELKSEMKSKDLAIFESMDIFIEAFNENADPPYTPLNEASSAWGLKIEKLTLDDDEYKLDYTIDGEEDTNEMEPHYVFMFYTYKMPTKRLPTKRSASGKRSRRRGKRSRRRGKK